MSAAMAAIQGSDGLWRTGLLDPDSYPLPENSGSAFFTYALAWGINHGILDRAEYEPVVEKRGKECCSTYMRMDDSGASRPFLMRRESSSQRPVTFMAWVHFCWRLPKWSDWRKSKATRVQVEASRLFLA